VQQRKQSSKGTIPQRAISALLRLPGIPIGSYVSEPISPLHRVDPRIKQAWLLALLLLPVRSSLPVRCGVDLFLIGLAMSMLPTPVWKPQLTQLALLCTIVYVFTALGSDSVPVLAQLRSPPPEMEGLIALPEVQPVYKYVLIHIGPIQVTRRSATLAGNAATLSFSILQSAHLCLSTTTPEALALSLRWYLSPLRAVGVPVEELTLTTLLALRFMALVFEELRGLAVGIASRGLRWEALRPLDALEIMLGVFRRLQSKLTAHAEVISEAMVARGFQSAEKHTILLDIEPRHSSVVADVVSLTMLIALSGWVVTQGDTL